MMTLKANRQLCKKIIKFWLPVVIWALVIFLFSSYPTKKASQIYWQDFVVKKLAHIVEYGILTTLIYRALVSAGVKRLEAGWAAVILAVLYGVSDEFHQSFTPGREPRIRDIFFDGVGSFLAVYFLVRYLPKASSGIKNIAKKLELY